MTGSILSSLQATFRGPLIVAGDPEYDAARALYNGMVDKRPRLIARCAHVADVIAAVNAAREHGLRTAVRGGGHSGPGFGACDDGLVIDVSHCASKWMPETRRRSLKPCSKFAIPFMK